MICTTSLQRIMTLLTDSFSKFQDRGDFEYCDSRQKIFLNQIFFTFRHLGFFFDLIIKASLNCMSSRHYFISSTHQFHCFENLITGRFKKGSFSWLFFSMKIFKMYFSVYFPLVVSEFPFLIEEKI